MKGSQVILVPSFSEQGPLCAVEWRPRLFPWEMNLVSSCFSMPSRQDGLEERLSRELCLDSLSSSESTKPCGPISLSAASTRQPNISHHSDNQLWEQTENANLPL